MNNMDFSLPPLSRSEAIIPAVVDTSFATPAPATPSSVAPLSAAPLSAAPSSAPSQSSELQNNPAFRAHLARLKSLREKVMQQATESIICFDYRQPPTPATASSASTLTSVATTTSISGREQLEVAEQFLSKLERLISESYQGRSQ